MTFCYVSPILLHYLLNIGHIFCVLLIGTQEASEDSQLRDAGHTADMIEQADRCQQPQGSGGSGLEEDFDLQDLSSPPDDQFMELHQAPSSAVHEHRPDSHQWHTALLSGPTATAEQAHHQLQKAASQQLHHERIAEAQQVHQSHKSSLQTLQGRGNPQHDGYQSMNGHSPFNPSKFVKKFTVLGLGAKTSEDPAVLADAALSTVMVCLLPLYQWAFATSQMPSAISVHEVSDCILGTRYMHTAAQLLLLHHWYSAEWCFKCVSQCKLSTLFNH